MSKSGEVQSGEIRQSVIDDPPRGEMVLVIGGASSEEAEAAAPSTLSVEDMAVLAIDRALEDGLRMKERHRAGGAGASVGRWFAGQSQASVCGGVGD